MKIILIVLSLLGFGQLGLAQNQSHAVVINLDFPVIDIPYQRYAINTTGSFIQGYTNPSMSQSLAMSDNIYTTAHWGINKLIKSKNTFKRILFSNAIAASFDMFTFYTPLGMGWLHEEYHRAVMTRRNINSFDDMNTFPFGQSEVSVRRVTDEDLIRLADTRKEDFRRLMIAGNEAQFHQIQTLQKNNFFLNQNLPNIPLYWMSSMTNIIYVNNCTSPDYDKLVDKTNAEDGTDIKKRDFTGPDFTAWASALFNPNRPYTDRGIHPSGIGINRYIKPSDLSLEEFKYLKRQGNLQWLNLLTPSLFGFAKIKIKSSEKGDYFGNFAVRHLLTSFGNDISLDVFYQSPTNNLFFSLHNFNNLSTSFWGLEASIIDKKYLKDKLLLSSKYMIWIQPKNQSFTSPEGSLGGLINLRGSYSFGNWFPYVELEGKTKGWVMGNVFLEDNVSLKCGFSFRIE